MGKFKYEKYDYSKVGICETKKWSSVYTVETLSGINAYNNIAAETELTRMLRDQIAAEIDRSILTALSTSFTTTTTTGPIYNATYLTNSTDFHNVYSNGRI